LILWCTGAWGEWRDKVKFKNKTHAL